MKRTYLIVPLIGLLLSGVAYWRYAARYHARIAAQERQSQLAKQEKTRAEQARAAVARQQAVESSERRKREREAEEQLENSRKQERLTAEQLRSATSERARKLRAQLERQRADAEALQATLAALDGRRRSLEKERDFLASYVVQAEGNRAQFFQLVEKLENLERARAAADAAPKSGAEPKKPRLLQSSSSP